MADSTLRIDGSQALATMDALEAKVKGLEKGFSVVGQASKSAFKVGADGAIASAEEIKALQNEYARIKQAADVLKGALKGAYDDRAIKQYSTELGKAQAGLAKLEQVAGAAGVSLKGIGKEGSLSAEIVSDAFGKITKASIILFLIEQVRELATSAVDLAQETQKAQLSFESFQGSAADAKQTLDDLKQFSQQKFLPVGEVLEAGKALLAFGENAGNLPAVLGRIADISKATGKNFNELATIYGKARTSGVLYAEDINQLTDAGIPIIQEFAKQMGVSTDQVKKLASEGKISFEELQLAFANLTKEGGKFYGQAESASKTLGGAWSRFVNIFKPALQSIGDAISFVLVKTLNFFSAIGEFFTGKNKVSVEIAAEYKGRDAYEQAKEDLYDNQKLTEEAEKRRKELAGKGNKDAEKLAKEREKLIIEAMKDGMEKEIAIENQRYKELAKNLRKFHIDTKDAEEQHQQNLIDILLKATEEQAKAVNDDLNKRLNLEKQYQDKLAQLTKDFNDEQARRKKEREDDANAQKEIGNTLIDITEEQQRGFIQALQQGGVDEKAIKEAQFEFDKQNNLARLRLELEFQKSILAITDEGDTDRVNAIQAKIELLKTKIENIASSAFGGSKKTKSKSLFEIIFGRAATEQEQKELNDAKKLFVEAFDQMRQAQVDAANAAVDAADKRVSAAENALDREIQLANAGFASNTTLREKELANAKAAQQKALEEKKRVQRQELIIDSVTQASKIATASAEIFAQGAKFWPAGLILSIASVAALLALFTSIKTRSKAIAQQFRTGGAGWLSDNGFVSGKSHEQGGQLLEVEGGELVQVGEDGGRRRVSIVRKERVRDHFDLLDAANKNDRVAMAYHALRLAGYSNAPEMDREGIRARVLNSVPGASKEPHGASDHQTLKEIKVILARIEKRDAERERWSPDGKTRHKGNTKTTFING